MKRGKFSFFLKLFFLNGQNKTIRIEKKNLRNVCLNEQKMYLNGICAFSLLKGYLYICRLRTSKKLKSFYS